MKHSNKGIGMRAVKTSIAVLICIAIYLLIVVVLHAFGVTTDSLTSNNTDFSGVKFTGWKAAFKLATEAYTPFFACIATAYSLSSTRKSSIKLANTRILASLIGGLFGVLLVFLYISITNQDWAFQFVSATGNPTGGIYAAKDGVDFKDSYILTYIGPMILTAAATLVTIWVCKLIKKPEAVFASVLTLTAVMTSLGTNPIVYGFNRIFSTIIGVLVALGVNLFRLPHRTKNQDILFTIDIEGVVREDESTLTGYMNYKINDMVDRGANVTLFTTRIPRTFMHLFGSVEINNPIVCMSGAALYDPKKLTYLAVETIPADKAKLLDVELDKLGVSPFKNYIIDDCLTVFNSDISNLGEKLMADKMKNGGYGNFFIGENPNKDMDVLFYMMIERKEKIEAIKKALADSGLDEYVVLQYYDYFDENSKVVPELVYVKLYSKKILELNVLKNYVQEKKLRVAGLTTNVMANHLLDNADIKITSVESNDENVIKMNSYDDIFARMSKIYYSSKYTRKDD